MAAIAPSTTEYSTQINKLEVRTDPAHNVVDPVDLGERVRIAKFDLTAVANIAQGVYLKLTKLPKGAKVIGFRGKSDGNSANASITYLLVPKGNLDTAAQVTLRAATANSAGSDVTLEPESAQVADDEAYVLAYLTHATTGTCLALGKTIKGHVLYVV